MFGPVSVIVPTFNRAALIGFTLDSILNQSSPPAEVIVVDDGSTDETESVVRGYPCKVQYHRIGNSGSPNARNVGVSKATSPWIAFCDSDDLWTHDKLEKQLTLHQESGVEYSFTNFRIVKESAWMDETKFDTAPSGFFKDFVPTSKGMIIYRPFYDDLLRFQPIFPSTVLISRRLFEEIGCFKPQLGRVRSEDFEFHLRCVQHYPIGVISYPVVGIRKHELNISSDAIRQTSSEVQILQYALQNHSISAQSKELIEEQIIERSIEVGDGEFSRGNFKDSSIWYSSIQRLHLDRKAQFKLLVSSCPYPIAWILRRLMLAVSLIQRNLSA